jgi:pyruvate formate lyase activating enzyme
MDLITSEREVSSVLGSNPLEDSLVTGIVFDIKRFSIHDGPGIRTTVFFKGCPLRCSWCHNPESQDRKPERIFWENRCLRCQACIASCRQGAIRLDGSHIITDDEKCILCGACVEACYAEARQIAGREMTIAQVMSEIERDIPFYDQSAGGVTFSGGEPLLQSDYLLALLLACKEWGIHAALDTCGFASWETLNRLRNHVDLFLYDLKLIDLARHKKYTGVSNIRILDNLQRLSEHGHNIILRVPIIPGINDDIKNIRAIGTFVADLPNVNRVDILPYHRAAISKYERLHRTYRFSELYPPSEDKMAEITQVLEEFGLQVKVGG